MNNDTRFRWLVFTSAMLAIFTYAVADESWIFGGLSIALAVIGWNVTERRGGRAVPRALIATAIVLAILWAIASGLREGLNVAHFCQFTIAVLVIKCYDRRTSADLGQFVMLCLFLSIGALLTSNSLWMALALIPTLLYSVAAAVAYQFHLGRVAARRSGVTPTRRPAVATRPPVLALATPSPIRGLARTLALGWFLVIAVSLTVFILFPRNVGADSFGRWGNAAVGMQTGFNDEVQLGEPGLISTSSAPVLDLTVRSIDGRVLGAPEETYYLRGAVLDSYSDGRWRASESSRQRIHDLAAGLDFSFTGGRAGSSGRVQNTLIELDVMIRNARTQGFHLFTVWRPRSIEFESRAVIRYGEDNGVVTRDGQSGRVRYTVICEPVEAAVAIPEGRLRTPVSHDSPPIAALAAEILRGAGLDPDPATRPIEDDAAAAAAIERYFDTGFEYTLDISAPSDNTDPIEWFLLEEKRGHCEYYASAMVALCRTVGINSRVVTGFVATEFNDATRHYVVRESNAHAWVEVEVVPPRAVDRNAAAGESPADLFYPGTSQWQRRDPTPSGEFRRIHRPDATIASQLRNLFEAVNYAWITSIVAFDDTTRTNLVSAMRIDTTALDQWVEDAGRRVRYGGSSLVARALTNALVAAVSVLCLGLALTLGLPALKGLWLSLLARLARLRGGARSARANQLAGASFYTRLLHALARRGHAKPDWQPPLAHARDLSSQELAPPASRVAEAFYRVRFGHAELTPADHAAIKADLAALD